MRQFLVSLISGFALAAQGATLAPVQLLSPTGSIAGQAIVSTGASSAPGWAAISAGSLAPIAANTVLGNFTGSSAAPTAFAVASCSTANSALKYTSGTGLSCGTNFALTSVNLSQFAATTSAQLLGVISDETGSGALVFGTSPTLTTPAIASITNGGTITVPSGTDVLVARNTTDTLTNKALTSPSISSPTVTNGTLNGIYGGTPAFSGAVTFSSAITPSQTAGIVGTTTNNNANAGSFGEYITNTTLTVGLTSGVTANITSTSLTAGDWDVECTFQSNPAGATTTSLVIAGVSTTSATFAGLGTSVQSGAAVPAGVATVIPTPSTRISLAGTTTAFCVASVNFAGSTMTGSALIRARRVR